MSAVVEPAGDELLPATTQAPATVLDVVIPVYNEEAQLAASVERVLGHLTTLPWSFRITIADNASTDQTALIARRLSHAHPEVQVVHLAEKGRGRALKRVWSSSDSDVLVYMDVDLSTDLAALLPLVAPLVSGHSDLAIGSRLSRHSRVTRGMKRELISRSYNLILRQTLRARFSDAQCGFKAVRRDAARELLPLVEDNAWFFDTELLVVAERAGLRIHEVPVDWVDDPDSSVAIVRTAVDDLKGVARLGRALVRGTLPLHEIGERLGRTSTEAQRGRLGMQVGVFLVIGVCSTLAYALLFLGLRSVTTSLWANFLALLLTAFANTAANRRFTFGVRGPHDAVRHQVQGLALFAAGLAVTSGALALLHASGSTNRALEVTVLTVGQPRRDRAPLRGDEALGVRPDRIVQGERALEGVRRGPERPGLSGLEDPRQRTGQQHEELVAGQAARVAHPLDHDLLDEGGPATHEQAYGGGVGEAELCGLSRDRGLEESIGQRRAGVLVDPSQLVVTAGRTPDERDVALVVLGDVVDVAGQRAGQLLQRTALAGRRGACEQVVGGTLHDGGVEVLLVAEVVVEQAPGDPGLLGEGLDGEVLQRTRGEQAHAEREQLLAPGVRREPDATRGWAAHVAHLTELPSTRLLTVVQYLLEWGP